eukprot:g5854.t1
MSSKNMIRALACGVLAASAGLAQAQPLTETFTYQGRLSDTSELADGFYDFQFRLFRDAAATAMIGNVITRSNVEVVDGLFTVTVNFGGSGLLFDGDRRWLEISVRPAGVGGYTTLSPAQEMTAAPHATFSSYAGIAEIAESAMTGLTDAYNNDSILDATSGPVAIQKSNGGLFDPATLRIGTASSGAGGQLLVTASNGNTSILASALGSSNSGNLQVMDALGSPMITSQMDVSTGAGGYFNVYRRNSGGSSGGSAIGFQVDGNFAGTESTQVQLRGEANTMLFQTHVSGDASVQLPSDAINASEMINEPGIAFRASSGGATLTPNASTIDIIDQRTINCPSSGYVLVIASAEADISHVNFASTYANFGVSNSAGSLPGGQDVELLLGNTLPGGSYDFPITVHSVFSVNAGNNTFYFLGDQNSTSGTFDMNDVALSCLFVPTAYGTISAPATWAGPQLDQPSQYYGGLTPDQSIAEARRPRMSPTRETDTRRTAMRRQIAIIAACCSPLLGQSDTCPGPLEAPAPPAGWRPDLADIARGAPGPCSEDGSIIDILIVYTPQAQAAAGGVAAMEALAAGAIADLNTAFSASGVPTTATLVGVESVSYNDSGFSSSDLSNLQQGAGALGDALTMRDETMADLVCMFVGSTDVCGRAYLAVWPGAIGREDLGFSIVSVACSGSPNLTFVHEIGHNLGIRHNYEDTPCSNGARSYARAYSAPDESFATAVSASGAPRVLMFSSPDVLIGGQPAGVPVGMYQEADASLALLDATLAVSRFRSYDQNNNGVCDADEITMGLADDCDANGVPDEVDIDFNRNGIPDACDISSGLSLDLDLDGVPDEAEASVINVDANAIGTTSGLDWAHAKTDLQDALALAAASGDVQEIWLASGTYTPGPAGARSMYFRPKRGVAIRGGFTGTETDPGQRDPQAPPTILSGDLAGDDTPGFGNRSDNAYHVVNLRDTSERVELDRLTISGGHADIEVNCSSEHSGGGLFTLHSDVLIRDCVFTDNAAYSGGGAGIQDGTRTRIYNSDFVANQGLNSDVWTSIGVLPGVGSTPAIYLSGDLGGDDNVLLNCRISDNVCDGDVSAIFAIGGQPTIANCLIARNVGHAQYGSSALRVQLADGTRIINCTIVDNHAPNSTYPRGVGVELFRTTAEISNSIIWGNADANGPDEQSQLNFNTGNSALSVNHSTVLGWRQRGAPDRLARSRRRRGHGRAAPARPGRSRTPG